MLTYADEAHRLRQRKALAQYPIYDKNNVLLGLPEEATELEWLLKCSKMQLLFYDSEQSVKPSDIPIDTFDRLFKYRNLLRIPLTSQLRCLGGDDYIAYVKDVLNGRTSSPHGAFKDYSHIGRGYLWNRTYTDWINSDRLPYEIGCIHTVQGYDLNYVGVIFGREIIYSDDNHRIEIVPENYKDKLGRAVKGNYEALREYIINIYSTLMTRGIRGAFVYVCDPALREYLRKFFG